MKKKLGTSKRKRREKPRKIKIRKVQVDPDTVYHTPKNIDEKKQRILDTTPEEIEVGEENGKIILKKAVWWFYGEDKPCVAGYYLDETWGHVLQNVSILQNERIELEKNQEFLQSQLQDMTNYTKILERDLDESVESFEDETMTFEYQMRIEEERYDSLMMEKEVVDRLFVEEREKTKALGEENLRLKTELKKAQVVCIDVDEELENDRLKKELARLRTQYQTTHELNKKLLAENVELMNLIKQ